MTGSPESETPNASGIEEPALGETAAGGQLQDLDEAFKRRDDDRSRSSNESSGPTMQPAWNGPGSLRLVPESVPVIGARPFFSTPMVSTPALSGSSNTS